MNSQLAAFCSDCDTSQAANDDLLQSQGANRGELDAPSARVLRPVAKVKALRVA